MSENLLQLVGRVATEPTSHGAQQIQIYRTLRAIKRGLRVQDILRAAREALHRNKILAADDA